MAEHLRFSVATGTRSRVPAADPFGPGTMIRPWNASGDQMEVAEMTLRAAFEFFTKLGVEFWCFHDRDIAPEADDLAEVNKRLDKIVDLAEKLQSDTGVKLLWGTANLFSHRRYMAGASTNPDPAMFAYAAARSRRRWRSPQRLGGAGYVFWGGREGYDTLLNTDIEARTGPPRRVPAAWRSTTRRRSASAGQFYIEPKPKEPTKHQYDFDAAACYAFLLEVRPRRATSSSTSRPTTPRSPATRSITSWSSARRTASSARSTPTAATCCSAGTPTSSRPTSTTPRSRCIRSCAQAGSRPAASTSTPRSAGSRSTSMTCSTPTSAAWTPSRAGLKIAAKMIEDGRLAEIVKQRYAGWDSGLGKEIESGKVGFEDLEAYTLKNGEPQLEERPAGDDREHAQRVRVSGKLKVESGKPGRLACSCLRCVIGSRCIPVRGDNPLMSVFSEDEMERLEQGRCIVANGKADNRVVTILTSQERGSRRFQEQLARWLSVAEDKGNGVYFRREVKARINGSCPVPTYVGELMAGYFTHEHLDKEVDYRFDSEGPDMVIHRCGSAVKCEVKSMIGGITDLGPPLRFKREPTVKPAGLHCRSASAS